jgi:hypothetical protein
MAAAIAPSTLLSAGRWPTTWLALAVLVAAVAACSEDVAPGGPLGRGIYIEEGWRASREVIGHHVHVVREAIACSSCHEMKGDTMGPANPARCAACHAKEATLSHAPEQARERFGGDARADCTVCHAFIEPRPASGATLAAHGGIHEATECARCHLQQQGDTPAVAVHGDAECGKCHRPHSDGPPVSAPCEGCHQDTRSTHATAGKSHTEACTTCHQHQHAPGSDALATCAECHARTEPIVPATAVFADGHGACVGCHRPHDFAERDAVACKSCHQGVPVLGAPRVAAHADCASCHSPHDVRASPEQACARCHTGVHSDHPKHGATGGTCVGCHDPHPSAGHATAKARTCSGCHQAAANEKSFHGGAECKQCHAPHDFARAKDDRRACRSCHAKELDLTAKLAGHGTCEGCHSGLPHKPLKDAAACASCHAKLDVPVTRGHATCTGCHEPHAGGVGAECKSCHTAEHQTAPRGHQACQSCHQAHSGSPDKATCSSCHAGEEKTAHGHLAQGCNGCHRPHGPRGAPEPPACATCHATASLPGLHKEAKHQDCGRCHTGHGEAKAEMARVACLTCHTDRQAHFPDAPRCSSCHLFDQTK